MRQTEYELIYVRVAPEIRDMLDKIARESERTITAVVERALRAEHERHEQGRE